ncbi:MAG: hypothetical protein M1823_002406 [Watsoniomyces obsoletus]|nr:MAG: hypothetical protein M1823_002406 [Watsoniomyces obsoletus]
MAPAKKAQPQKMSLGDFLTDESLGSWAEEMESMPIAPMGSSRPDFSPAQWGVDELSCADLMAMVESRAGYGERRAFSTNAGGFSSGMSDRGSFGREQLPLPDKPPFTAHIGNLSFDVTQSEVMDFFADCSVSNVRIVEDKLERKPKGFGYVEFSTLDGLKKALNHNGAQFSGRNIRVSVADPPKDRDRGEARDITDWTRKGPLPALPNEQRRTSDRGGFGSRNFDSASDAGSDRGDRRRAPFEQGDGKVRDFSNWERKGPLSPLSPGGPAGGSGGGDISRPRTREGPREGPRDRRQSPAWGEGRSQDGSRPPRREFQERPQADRAPTAPELDNQWRSRMRPDPPVKSATPSHDASDPPSPPGPPALTVRPKLNLQKRTVSEAESTSPGSTTATENKANPFGGARPIDTSAREREIEERRQQALRQKKEQEEKVREERRQAKEAARAEKAASAQAATTDDSKPKENGETTGSIKSPTNFEVLGRAAQENGGDTGADEEQGEDEKANGTIVDDKEVKPQTIVQDIPSDKTREAWRGNGEKKPAEGATTPTPTADALEEDGWSTVGKSKNSRRGPAQAARAIAS